MNYVNTLMNAVAIGSVPGINALLFYKCTTELGQHKRDMEAVENIKEPIPKDWLPQYKDYLEEALNQERKSDNLCTTCLLLTANYVWAQHKYVRVPNCMQSSRALVQGLVVQGQGPVVQKMTMVVGQVRCKS